MFFNTSKESIEMTVKDLHTLSSHGTLEPWKLVQTLLLYVFILDFIYLSSKTGKEFNSMFFKSSILSMPKDINLLFLSLSPSLTLNY